MEKTYRVLRNFIEDDSWPISITLHKGMLNLPELLRSKGVVVSVRNGCEQRR